MRILLLLAVFAFAPAHAADVYRWVDADGVVHYSDQWQPGAEKIRILDSPTYRGARTTEGDAAGTAPPGAPPAAPGYTGLKILSPAQEEVLWNIGGKLTVSLRLTPGLQEGHRLRLFLDGAEREIPPGGTEAVLQDVYRGVHTLTADVVNAADQVQVKSEPTTFVVRQTSVPQPATSRPRP